MGARAVPPVDRGRCYETVARQNLFGNRRHVVLSDATGLSKIPLAGPAGIAGIDFFPVQRNDVHGMAVGLKLFDKRLHDGRRISMGPGTGEKNTVFHDDAHLLRNLKAAGMLPKMGTTSVCPDTLGAIASKRCCYKYRGGRGCLVRYLNAIGDRLLRRM